MNSRDKKIVRGVTVSMSVQFFTGIIPSLREMGYEVVSVSSDGPELQDVRSAGGRVVTVEMARRMSPLKDLKSLWQLIKVLRRERPMMIHSMTPKAGLLCMMAGKLTGVPVRVHTFTGLVFPTSTGLKRRILMATDRLTCACATHVVPEGEGVKADLINNHITGKPLRVLGHGNCRGIDLQRFNPDDPEVMAAAEALRRPDCFTFVYIGRILREKGINELVEAFCRLYDERPDVRLILVGPSEDDLDPVTDLTRRRIAECPGIEAVGSQADVRPFLLASDAFILPSYREGFPNVVIEAGAMGLPSIVTDINGSREIILDGLNGLIVEPRNADALYGAMKRMATDSELTAAMRREARPLIASRYEQGFVRQCLLDFYREILPKN